MMWWCCNRLLGRPLFPVCLDVWAPQGSALFPHSSPILMRHVTNDVFTSNQTHRLPLKLQRNETNETNKQIIKQNWSLPLFLWIKPPPTHTHIQKRNQIICCLETHPFHHWKNRKARENGQITEDAHWGRVIATFMHIMLVNHFRFVEAA